MQLGPGAWTLPSAPAMQQPYGAQQQYEDQQAYGGGEAQYGGDPQWGAEPQQHGGGYDQQHGGGYDQQQGYAAEHDPYGDDEYLPGEPPPDDMMLAVGGGLPGGGAPAAGPGATTGMKEFLNGFRAMDRETAKRHATVAGTVLFKEELHQVRAVFVAFP